MERADFGSVTGLLELVTGKIQAVADIEGVIGSPIELGGVTVVPLSSVSVGLAAAGGVGEGQGFGPGHGPHKHAKFKAGGKGVGGGSGGGAKLRPVGVAILTADGVDILPIEDRKGLLEKLLDKIPKIVETVQNVQSQIEGGKAPKD